MNIVKDVLEKEQRDLEKFKTIQVEKLLDCRTDLGMLMCTDPNELDEKSFKSNKDKYLLDLTRDNVQILLNQVWELETDRVEECIVAKLPPPTYVLPRSRKCPVEKQLTKWEKFAKEKGIKKTKKDKKVFDTELDKWVPTYGFKRAQAEKDKTWVLEVPKNADPMEDQFKKKLDVRSEKVAKNEIKRMKNVVRSKKIEVPRVGYLGPQAASATQLLTAATIAKSSTASVGKFQEKLPKEKEARGIGVKELIPGSKRKASHISNVPENIQNLELINSVLNKKPKLDVEKAISVQKREARQERESNPPQKKGKGGGSKRSKRGGKIRSAKSKKPKAGAGERDPKKRAGGRKRR